MKYIDKYLDKITMYRLVVYVLAALVALGVVFSMFGRLAFSPTAIVVSLAVLLIPAYLIDKGLGRLFQVPTNSESWLISALILFLIIQPAHSVETAIGLALAGAVSSASKYLLTWHNKHIFNPAAFAAALVSLTALAPTTWWIGNSAFWPFTVVLGLAVVRKIRRGPLVLSFFAGSITLQLLLFVLHNQPIAAGMKGSLIASPLLFLATIMVTEPATMPPRRRQQLLFAAIVAVLYVMAWRVGPFIIYPEVALLLGNIYAFVVSPKLRVRLQLKEIQRISDRVYNYVFQPDRRFAFLPGQYMEWTLPGVRYDSRGNRRTFTIASSPTEEDVQLGLRYYQPASAYKAAFGQLKIGDSIYASQLAGNFTVCESANKKLAFVAGGIGITPFRSIAKYYLDKNLQRDIVLLYVVSDPAEFVYARDFLEARRIGLRLVPIVTQTGYVAEGVVSAKLTQQLIAEHIPDYAERTFYISGPSSMVDATQDYLHDLHVPGGRIITDHFSGY